MSYEKDYDRLNQKRLLDKDTQMIIGISHGIIADNKVNQEEAEYLQKWLMLHQHNDNPLFRTLFNTVQKALSDEYLSEKESQDILTLLKKIAGEESELGELFKPSSFPINKEIPPIIIEGSIFVLTGKFAMAKNRKECENLIQTHGGIIHKNVTLQTDYLVIGEYVTSSWVHETFGRKIELAMEYRSKTNKPAIIQEKHLRPYLK